MTSWTTPDVPNGYAVLMTRGIRGTYVYVCDPSLRAHRSRSIPGSPD